MTEEKCFWCGKGFEHNEPRATRDINKVFHIVSREGEECLDQYYKEVQRVFQEEQRRRAAFEKM